MKKYEHTAVRGGMKAKIVSNLAILFHYVHFFRALAAHEQDVLVFAAVDLKMDYKVLNDVYHEYRQARRDFEAGMNDGIPDGADEVDSVLCSVVDRVITMRRGREMIDEELQAKSNVLREEWKVIMADFNKERDNKTPFSHALNNLLLDIIKTVEEERQDKSSIHTGNGCEEENTSDMFLVSSGIGRHDDAHNAIDTIDDATLGALAVQVVKEVGRRCDARRQDPAISSGKRLWYWIGVVLAERFLNWAATGASVETL